MARTAKERACPNCGVVTIKKPYENQNGKTSWARWDNARNEWHDGMLAAMDGPTRTPCKIAQQKENRASYHFDAETRTELDTKEKGTEMAESSVFKIFAREIEQYLSTKPDMEEVRAEMTEMVEDFKKNQPPQRVVLVQGDLPEVDVSNQHPMLPTIVQMMHSRDENGYRNTVMMKGEPASGKTYLAKKVAEILGLDFTMIQISKQTTNSQILGYMDANGNYVESEFYKAYKHGKLYLIDEMDNGGANTIAIFNAGIDGDRMAFPCGMVMRHKDFACIATANTWGRGANAEFMGRAPLCKASLSRFIRVELPVDEAFELKIFPGTWTEQVQAYRRKAAELGIRAVISPRQSKQGMLMLAAGMDLKRVRELVIFSDLNETDRRALEKATVAA